MHETETEAFDSDKSETWTSYDDYSSYDDEDELESQIELIQEQMSQSGRLHGEENEPNSQDEIHENLPICLEGKENWTIKSEYDVGISDQNSDFEKMKIGENQEFRERSRISSRDSFHSNPKAWSEFEEENRSWRPINYEGNGRKEVFTTNADSLSSGTRVSIESSEGYKSDELKKYRRKLSKKNSIKKEKIIASQIQSKRYSQPEMESITRFRKNSIQSMSDTGSSTHDQILPIKIKDIIQIHVEPEEKIRIQKNIERIKRLGNQTDPEYQLGNQLGNQLEISNTFYSDIEQSKYEDYHLDNV
jgi:hypothetical protein